MKKMFHLFLCFFLLFYACRDASTPQNVADEIGLEKLMVENTSVLEKMDERLFCNFGDVEKYSVSLTVKPKNQSSVNVLVATNGENVSGSLPYYTCPLLDGNNEIKIVVSSKKDASNKKTYVVKINKKPSTVPDENSSKLKELKVDGESIISEFANKNTVTLRDVAASKNSVRVYFLTHNASATVDVSNEEGSDSYVDKNTREVTLAFGQNEIRVIVTSEAEGDKLHIIKIYREEDLRLSSFNVDGEEYYEANSDKIKVNTIKFSKEIEEAKVSIEARADSAKVSLKSNGNKIEGKNGSFKVSLSPGRNNIEAIVEGKGGYKKKTYTVNFLRMSPSADSKELTILRADDEDVLHLLSKENIITLHSCNNEKTTLKVEARAEAGVSVKVFNNGSEVSGDGIYNVSLNEGNNKIEVKLHSASNLVNTYSIFITRFPAQQIPEAPTSDEVQIEIVLSDGVNGSSVDGSYINILKTKDGSSVGQVLVRNGKVKVNLKKDDFYDFRVEGQNTDFSQKRYAASDVTSYYVDEKTKTVPIVQFPLQRITRPAEAPLVKEFKFGEVALNAGEETSVTGLKSIELKVASSSIIKELDHNSPLPMLAVGFVPTTSDDNKNVMSGNQSGKTVKNADGKFESVWKWSSLSTYKLIKGDVFDVVIVLYDVANNRLECHRRFKTSDTVAEDDSIKITDLTMEFKSYPTPSRLFSVGNDAFTHNSSHYSNKIKFRVKKGFSHTYCLGFDIYRKCVEDGGDFRLVKHFMYQIQKISSSKSYHEISDNDGLLEEEKTYQYKIVAYTNDGKKSKLESSPMIELKVPKSTSLLLVSPVDVAISKNDAKNMDYVLKLSNPKILETAKEIHLGFLISDRQGSVPYCSKFKYVFNDSNGKDEIYFAMKGDEIMYQGYYYLGTGYSKKRNSVTNKQVEELIIIDKALGTIKFTKNLTSLSSVNLAKSPKAISYIEGYAYYWDVLDYGTEEYSDFDDNPCKIISEERNGVTIYSHTNDYENGNNAWNGRGQFTIRFD